MIAPTSAFYFFDRTSRSLKVSHFTSSSRSDYPITQRQMDTVILRDLSSQAHIGLDCWGRDRTQPVLITALVSTDVSQAGLTDKADDLTVDYSALGKSILARIEKGKFVSLHELAKELAEEVVPGLSSKSKSEGQSGGEVKIIASAPKQLLCADALRITVIRSTTKKYDVIDIHNLQANLVLGLNPPERRLKQRVLVNISLDVQEQFFQCVDTLAIQLILGGVLDFIEKLELFTLEALVSSIALETYKQFIAGPRRKLHESINSLTIRAEKPSGTTAGQSTGVEVTRTGQWMRTRTNENLNGQSES